MTLRHKHSRVREATELCSPETPFCFSHTFARDSCQQGIYKQLHSIVQGYGVGLCPRNL